MDAFNPIKYVYNQDSDNTDGKWFLFGDVLKDNFIWSVSVLTIITITIYGWYYWRQWVIRGYERASLLSQHAQAEANRLRFRKRDKMLFYGRRIMRKVKTTGQAVYGGQGRKRRAVMRFAKRILQLKRESIPMQIKTVEPPAEYLEEMAEGSDRVPPDALYMLQGIRIFGHFEKPIFLKLCRHTEIINLDTNDLLFKIGDIDDSVFIVQSGLLNVLINNADGSTLSLKLVKKGESVTSLLSFIDVLNGNASVYKSVTAKAVERSTVIRLPMDAFKEIFEESPDILIRVMQVIMIRLQRVTFTALRNYLGLSSELVQNRPKRGSLILNKSPINKKQLQDLNPVHSLSTEVLSSRPDMLADLSDSNVPYMGHSRKPSGTLDQTDEPTLYSIAVDGFMKELGLEESEKKLLEGHVELKEAHPGVTILTEGKTEDVCLVYILSGSLTLVQQGSSIPGSKSKADSEVHSHNAYPGEMIGGLAVLTGESSLYTVRAKHYSRIALLKRNTVYSIMRVKPTVVLDVANTVVRRLSPLVRQCDYALDWIFLESGRAVYRQDEIGDSTYIVLSGRLRSVVTQANGKKEIVGEYGKGDMVGIVEMITETSRTTTALAVRDSELAKLPEGLFNAIKIKYPVVVTKLIRLLSHRILAAGSMPSKPGATPLEANPVTHKYSTVALVPVSEDVPLTAFTYELYHSLCAVGPSLRLTSDVVRKSLGVSILEPNYEYRLTSWLAQQEDRNIITLYQCDYNLSAWTQRCMRQADVIIIVGLGDRAPTVGKFEKEIDKMAMRTQKELVLLHRESANKPPVNTLQWLNLRPWVTNHHHIQCAKRMFTRKSQYRINDLYSKVLMSEPNMHSDFSRLARWLTGNSVGLVLGGGGARGAAHVGMLKAIQEAGIPIDMVGGVSIGAFMGALWCVDRNIATVTQKAREWSKKMTQWHRQILDLTYPITSMFSGRGFNETIRDTFGDIYIEDLWTPYFTLTTDITASTCRVHTNADVMYNLGAAHIIAVDVGSQDDTDLTDYGDDLSGWWLLYKKWNPFTTPVKVPNLPDIQSRLAYVSCVRQLEEVKNSSYCEYIRPPIDKYKTLAFGSFDEIKEVGYVHGRNCFDMMAKSGRLGRFNQWFSKELPKKHSHSLNEYTFIDLAQIVCKLPETRHEKIDPSSSSDEEYDGYISEPTTLNRNLSMRVLNRGTGSLSLSENEMDSDEFEYPSRLSLQRSEMTSSTSSLPNDTKLSLSPDHNGM
ncbi:neuropathy target esterase sws isoform X4 [Bradysia coprophila]|uniref:neuropathy target esterase sws isoform X4 n=1 Tax=Bradysia coprophila TaxID=38358 RepID=UPI00187DCEBE|nr:neuropathy target esterase sws isoform X4 [Bradysia coprophila]